MPRTTYAGGDLVIVEPAKSKTIGLRVRPGIAVGPTSRHSGALPGVTAS